jgi:hypothetical protein
MGVLFLLLSPEGIGNRKKPGPGSTGLSRFFNGRAVGVTKSELLGCPGGFIRLKNGRTLVGNRTAVVRKPPWIRRPGKLGANRP